MRTRRRRSSRADICRMSLKLTELLLLLVAHLCRSQSLVDTGLERRSDLQQEDHITAVTEWFVVRQQIVLLGLM